MTESAPSSYVPKLRLDRLFCLAEAESYPGTDCLDSVLFWPVREAPPDTRIRIWLRTGAVAPRVEINTLELTPVGKSSADPAWVDFGIHTVESLREHHWVFGIMRFRGISFAESREALFVLTTQPDVELGGDRVAVEDELWGISRAAVGHTVISPSRVGVGEAVEFRFEYTVGSGGLPPGALIRLAFPKLFAAPQADDPMAPGWLEAIESELPVELVSIDTSVESHERLDAIFRLPNGAEPGVRVAFSYRTEDTYLFPRRWATMERRYWYSQMPVMALAVAVDERQIFVPPEEANGHAVEFVAGPPERLHLFLPGRVKAGEPVVVHGLFTDRYRNSPPSRGPVDAEIELVIEGEGRSETLGSPAGRFERWYRFAVPLIELDPGVYRVRAVRPGTDEVLAVSNPVWILPEGSDLPAIYWGEIHGHCEQSDGSGDYAGMFEHARDEGCLDFAASADHACYFSDNEWQWMQDIVNSFDEDGRFTTLIGYEWAGKQGHRNVYTSGERLQLFRGMFPPTSRLDAVYGHFADREDVVAGPHTRHTADFFAYHDERVQRFLEIYSMWGAFEEIAFDAVARGAVIGFTGGGDCHEGRCGFSVEDPAGQGTTGHTFAPGLRYKCGMTGAMLPGLTRADLVQALRERRTYATTGARILLDVSLSGIAMGGQGGCTGAPHIDGIVHACSEVDRVQVIRDGEVVHTEESPAMDVTFAWADKEAAPGKHWYVLKVVQRDGETAWSSPIWVTVAE